MDKVKFLERELDNKINLNRNLHYDVDIEKQRAAELSATLAEIDNKLRQKEMMMRDLAESVGRMRVNNASAQEDCSNLNGEIHALTKHMDVLNGQNYTLNRELDGFVETDIRVRAELDRRQRVANLRSKNDAALKKSKERVKKSVSPLRSPYKKRR